MSTQDLEQHASLDIPEPDRKELAEAHVGSGKLAVLLTATIDGAIAAISAFAADAAPGMVFLITVVATIPAFLLSARLETLWHYHHSVPLAHLKGRVGELTKDLADARRQVGELEERLSGEIAAEVSKVRLRGRFACIEMALVNRGSPIAFRNWGCAVRLAGQERGLSLDDGAEAVEGEWFGALDLRKEMRLASSETLGDGDQRIGWLVARADSDIENELRGLDYQIVLTAYHSRGFFKTYARDKGGRMWHCRATPWDLA